MRIIAFETSAKAASVAVAEDGFLLAEYYQNSGQTHSRTVMKMAQDLLANCDLSPHDIDCVAFANGPGSFTGIRIGAAAAKGFCWGADLPCVPVSTLEGMAYGADFDGVICACMDARREQVYNALFQREHGSVRRLCDDRAISLQDLSEEIKSYKKSIYLLGDGANLCYNTLKDSLPDLVLVPEHRRHQRAGGIALAGLAAAAEGKLQTARTAVPNYLRLSQAERERLKKEENKGE